MNPVNDPPIRLQKILAQQGLGSRRQIESWIESGRIRVNGKVAKLGDKISKKDKVFFKGKKIALISNDFQKKLLLYHKPVGEVSTCSDEKGRKTVFEKLPKLAKGRWINIGRLDINTSGVLLFTNCGDFAYRAMHPKFGVTRRYLVRILGTLSSVDKQALTKGIVLEDGLAHFDTLVCREKQGANQWVEVSLTQGKNRLVRRLFAAKGMQVSRLIRTHFGGIQLPKNLAPGKFVFLESAGTCLKSG